MKKLITNNYEKYFTSYYTSIHDDEIQNIRNNYKVIDVDWLDNTQVNSKIMNDEYFEKSPKKKELINNMLNYYRNDKFKNVYKMTEYLCNEKEKICICNTHAADFRKIYEGINYNQNQKYISWCKNNDNTTQL